MNKPLYPADALGWAWLQKNPLRKPKADLTALAGVILAAGLCLAAMSAVAYDQLRDARWDAEFQATCNSVGC